MAVTFELVAYLADILTIAEEDNAMHGDISPGDVYINEKGAVSLSNYGPMRTRGRAPEGKPLFPASDVYGLGLILHAVLSTQPLGAIPRQRDAHDDAIVDRLLAIDWSDLEELPGRDSLIHFICSMLAHDPSERPAPLDVANVLAGAGVKIGGMGLVRWAEQRWGRSGSIQEEMPTISEVLEAPEELGRVFNKTGQYSRRQTASAKGECTAFWSRDKISAMLDEGEDPLAGSQMFQRRDLQKKLNTDSAGPPVEVPKVYREPVSLDPVSSPTTVEKPWAPDATITGSPSDPEMAAAMDKLRQNLETTRENEPVRPNSTVEPTVPPPSVKPESVAPVSPPPERPTPKKPFPWLVVVIGAVGMGLVLGMLALAAAIYYSVNDDPPSQTVAVAKQTDNEPAAQSKPKAKTKAKPKPARKKPTPSRPPPPPPPKKSKPVPPPRPPGEFEVSFRSMGAEAQLRCGDGQSGRFVGTTRRTFTDVTSCLVTIDDKKGAIQVKRESTVSCKVVGTSVVCSGA
jgi:serine/threonine protein kinase